MDKDNLVSIPKYAEHVGVSRQRVWQKVNEGKIKAYRIGRMWVINKDEVWNKCQSS